MESTVLYTTVDPDKIVVHRQYEWDSVRGVGLFFLVLTLGAVVTLFSVGLSWVEDLEESNALGGD